MSSIRIPEPEGSASQTKSVVVSRQMPLAACVHTGVLSEQGLSVALAAAVQREPSGFFVTHVKVFS